jgi:hypothetical protein
LLGEDNGEEAENKEEDDRDDYEEAQSRRPRLEEEGTKKHEAARHVAKDHNWGKCMRSTTVKTEHTKWLNR